MVGFLTAPHVATTWHHAKIDRANQEGRSRDMRRARPVPCYNQSETQSYLIQ